MKKIIVLNILVAIFFLVFVKMSIIIKIMTTKNIMLGPMEVQFFAWTQLENKDQVQTGDLVKSLNLSPKQEADLFYNLSSSGFIIKLQRGFYLIPNKIPSRGLWSPSPYLVINKYMENAGATKFHISGPAVFNKYGYSNQLSSWFTVYNDKISKKMYILQYHLDFTKVVPKYLGVIKKMKSYIGDENLSGQGSAHRNRLFLMPFMIIKDMELCLKFMIG